MIFVVFLGLLASLTMVILITEIAISTAATAKSVLYSSTAGLWMRGWRESNKLPMTLALLAPELK
jgi:hypothetical protein